MDPDATNRCTRMNVDQDPASPLVRRLRLAAELKRLRESANCRVDAVASALGWSRSKVSRYERAKTGLPPRRSSGC
jgi:ParB-like chromosome segregation protein Spo0J